MRLKRTKQSNGIKCPYSYPSELKKIVIGHLSIKHQRRTNTKAVLEFYFPVKPIKNVPLSFGLTV